MLNVTRHISDTSRDCDWTKVEPPVGTRKGDVSIVNCRVSVVPYDIAERAFMFQENTAEGDLFISAPTKYICEKVLCVFT